MTVLPGPLRTPPAAPGPGSGWDARGHRHGTACYWDVAECGWHCGSPKPSPAASPEQTSSAPVVLAPESPHVA
jgi:hypothetical protein